MQNSTDDDIRRSCAAFLTNSRDRKDRPSTSRGVVLVQLSDEEHWRSVFMGELDVRFYVVLLT